MKQTAKFGFMSEQKSLPHTSNTKSYFANTLLFPAWNAWKFPHFLLHWISLPYCIPRRNLNRCQNCAIYPIKNGKKLFEITDDVHRSDISCFQVYFVKFQTLKSHKITTRQNNWIMSKALQISWLCAIGYCYKCLRQKL